MPRNKLIYPFSAIVGQEKMKKALLLNAINPKIGGVLLRGEKGTAKSLAVRALADLLPEIEVVADCPFLCDPRRVEEFCEMCAAKVARGEKLEVARKKAPFVELPLGATEDRVVGTLDIERAIKTGEKRFEPGLLAAANRGILYIDEVNLLDDHLVDVLLDAAAMGVNYVEREGISFSHPARFILVGTMNPEEGELRPQLLDRFGLAVEVRGLEDPEERAEVVRRRMAFEENPAAFIASWEKEQEALRRRIEEARRLLPEVGIGDEMLKLIARICLDFGVDGHRADIVMCKTAATLAAFYGRTGVTEEDVREAAELALPHRRRRKPFEEPGLDRKRLEESFRNWHRDKERSEGNSERGENSPPADFPPHDPPEDGEEPQEERIFEAEPPYRVRPIITSVRDEIPRSGAGRRSKSRTNTKAGRYVGSMIPRGKVTDLALDATLRAAAPFQVRRRKENPQACGLIIESFDLRQKVRERKVGNLILFVLDASGSMAAEERMAAAKGAVLSLLIDAYERRDRVGMVVFRGEEAKLVLPPTNSVDFARKLLREIPTGGRTPLASGLKLALDVIERERRREKGVIPLLVLISDGRANVSFGGDPVEDAKKAAREIKRANIGSLAIDTEQRFPALGLVREISDEMGGIYLRLEELRAEPIASAIREHLEGGRA